MPNQQYTQIKLTEKQMRRKIYIPLAIVTVLSIITIGIIALGRTILSGLGGIGNPTGGYHSNSPYFITTEPTIIKKLIVPKGTTLTYYLTSFAEGRQAKIMEEKNIEEISLPKDEMINWGGLPVNNFRATGDFDGFSNSMGFKVYADFNQLSNDKKTKFSELWQSCNDGLSIYIENKADWTFNIKNITGIESCGINNQRYFKEDKRQQQFLDELYAELKKIK